MTPPPPLFICDQEIIQSKKDTLRFYALIWVLEVIDFSLPEESDDDQQHSSNSSNDGDDGYPGYDAGPGLLRPWPKICRLMGDTDGNGNQLPSLTLHGGGARWPTVRDSLGGDAKGPRSLSSVVPIQSRVLLPTKPHGSHVREEPTSTQSPNGSSTTTLGVGVGGQQLQKYKVRPPI
jgi:hypothetical protein